MAPTKPRPRSSTLANCSPNDARRLLLSVMEPGWNPGASRSARIVWRRERVLLNPNERRRPGEGNWGRTEGIQSGGRGMDEVDCLHPGCTGSPRSQTSLPALALPPLTQLRRSPLSPNFVFPPTESTSNSTIWTFALCRAGFTFRPSVSRGRRTRGHRGLALFFIP